MRLGNGKVPYPLNIELDLQRMGRDAATYFTVGDPICGWVEFSCTKPEAIATITTKFFGATKSFLNRAGAEGSVWSSANTTLFALEKQWEINRTLDPGIHKWSWSATFPQHADPDWNMEKYEENDIFEAGKHPLPPSCSVLTTGYSLSSHGQVYYGVEASFTRPEAHGEDYFEADSVSIPIKYALLRSQQAPDPQMEVVKERTYTCRSVGLLPNRTQSKLSLYDKAKNLVHKSSVPAATFSLSLKLSSVYTIGQPMPILLQVKHNPDGHDTPGISNPDLFLTNLKITIHAFNNVRGFSKWNGQNSATDLIKHVVLNSKKLTKWPLKEGILDLTTLDIGDRVIWPRAEHLPPTFKSWSCAVVYTVAVELVVVCGGKNFELNFNDDPSETGWTSEVLPEQWMREHRLDQPIVIDEDYHWSLIGDNDEDRYLYTPTK